MNKSTYKKLGIAVFAVFAVISIISMAAFTSINFKLLLLLFLIAVILLGISVMFFIRAGIIPKWTKYVVYGYYILVLLVFILAFFGGLGRVLWGT